MRPSTLILLFAAVLYIASAGYAQTADKRVDDILRLHEQTNSDIAVAEREAPYSDIYVVELSVNKTGNAYPAGATYSSVAKFYYTAGGRGNDRYPSRLLKINVVTKRSTMITTSEFLYNPGGQLTFGLVRTDGVEQRETRLFYAGAQLIKMLDGDRDVNIRMRSVIDTSAALKRESARLVALFASALKEGF